MQQTVPQNLQFCGIKLHLTNVCIYYALETLYLELKILTTNKFGIKPQD